MWGDASGSLCPDRKRHEETTPPAELGFTPDFSNCLSRMRRTVARPRPSPAIGPSRFWRRKTLRGPGPVRRRDPDTDVLDAAGDEPFLLLNADANRVRPCRVEVPQCFIKQVQELG